MFGIKMACARWFARQAHEHRQIILNRIEEMKSEIMSAISTFLVSQKAYNDQQAVAIDSLVTSITGVTKDVQTLNEKITELQNSQGGVTPEDQLLIDELQTSGAALAAKLQTAVDALKAVDEATPPKAPPV